MEGLIMITIYKITNTLNSKIYVGITNRHIQERLCDHFNHSVKPKFRIHQAIKKHGKQNFIIEAIDIATSQEEANQLEKYWINYYNCTDYNFGYNMSCGGSGKSITLTEKTKNKIKESVQKHRDSLSDYEKRQLTKAANIAKKGNKESADSRDKKSLAQTKRWKTVDDEYKKEHGVRSRDGTSVDGKLRSLTALKNSYSPAREPGIKKPKIQCPYCGKIGGAPIMKRYHFDNCKEK
jgi:group I intron endonuclease